MRKTTTFTDCKLLRNLVTKLFSRLTAISCYWRFHYLPLLYNYRLITLATEPIFLSRSAGTNLISLVFLMYFPQLRESPPDPTTYEVSFPSLHTDAGVTGR